MLYRLNIILWMAFAVSAFAQDFHGEFVRNVGGNLALRGLPGFASSPARIAEPGFGAAFAYVPDADIAVAGMAGEFCVGPRVAFSSSYLELDSIYRRVYSEIDLSLARTWFILGAGYGYSVEWIPGEQNWNRHRYKAGSALLWRGISFAGIVSGWTDLLPEYPDYALGVHVSVAERFSVFGEWDGYSLDIGNTIRFKYVQVQSAYRFPGFGVSLSISFILDGWSIGGAYGFAGSNWNWIGGGVSKFLRKKTIL